MAHFFTAGFGRLDAAYDNNSLFACTRSGQVTELSPTGKPLRHLQLNPPSNLLQVCVSSQPSRTTLVGWSNWKYGVFGYDEQGRLLWEFQPNDHGVDWVAVTATGAEKQTRVIVGYNGSGGVYVLDEKGTVLGRNVRHGNCWNVGFVHSGAATGSVLTSSADGAIHVLDEAGHDQQTLRPEKAYFDCLLAARLKPKADEEILAIGIARNSHQETLYVFSSSGQLRWKRSLGNEFC